jgi:16S rRNA (cytidine1402-2'-O)-methyltransferase
MQFTEVFGKERKCCVSREISKVFEEHVRGTLNEVTSHFSGKPPKGEFVIIVAGL